MKPTPFLVLTGEDVARFLKEDAEPLSEAQKAHVDRCRKKYEKYFSHKKTSIQKGKEVNVVW